MRIERKFKKGIAILFCTTISLSSVQNICIGKNSDVGEKKSGKEINSSKKIEAKKSEVAEDYYYFADRNAFPADAKYFDYDTRPWTDEEKAAIGNFLDQLKKEAPGVVALASVHGKLPLFRSPIIPYRNILGHATKAYVLAVDSALFIGDDAESQKDLKRILLHEIVHMADLGRSVAYSQAWVKFASPDLQRARRQVSCQFLLDSKTSEFAESHWPSTESCTSYKESLCELTSKYVLDSKFRKEHKEANNALVPILSPSEKELEFAKQFMNGRIFFRATKMDEAIPCFESASKLAEFAPSPHIFLAQCWYEKGDNEKASAELVKAKDLFARAKIGMTESLHWRTLSMLANSEAMLNKFDVVKALLDRLASSRVQYDPSIFQRRSLCNEKTDDLGQAMLDYYDFQFLTAHAADSSHYFDFFEDREFLKEFLSKKFPAPDGRRSHVFSICWERLAIASTGEERQKCIESALAEVHNATATGYYTKDDETIRTRYLAYLNGSKENDFEKLAEQNANKNHAKEFEVLRYLAGKPFPPKGSEEFANLLKHTGPTDPKETRWLF